MFYIKNNIFKSNYNVDTDKKNYIISENMEIAVLESLRKNYLQRILKDSNLYCDTVRKI